MPELPEVQTIVATLQPHLPGRTILRAQLSRTDILTPQGINLPKLLAGRTVRSITRRGKKILIHLDTEQTFCIHLGMTGRLTLEPPTAPLQPHTHLIITLERASFPSPGTPGEGREGASFPSPGTPGEGREGALSPEGTNRAIAFVTLRFRDPRRFGRLHFLDCDESPDANLGPEPLTITPRQLAARLARTRRPIKFALLDQSLLAGLGNIYVDESLHRARIHPLAPANTLTPAQIRLLTRSIKSTLRQAIASKGSSLRDYVDADGKKGAFQKLHRVYARETHPCPSCGTAIQRIVLSGRSTHFCPACQPPAPPPTQTP